MAVDYSLISKVKNHSICIYDLKVSEIQELVLLSETREYALEMIGQASIKALADELIARTKCHMLNDEFNQRLIEETKDVVFVKNGKVLISKAGVLKSYAGFFSAMFEINREDDIEINWPEVVKNMINLPRNIKLINTNFNISNSVKKIQKRYLEDENSEYNLPKRIERGVNEIFNQAVNEPKFYERMKEFGVEEFLNESIKGTTEFGKVCGELVKDFDKLFELKNKQKQLLRR